MKLCTLVIWYNPDEECISHLNTYLDIAEKTYIVDNSSKDNSYLLNNLPKVEYIPLLDNKGIATAQNIGCQKALADGFEWCMTMDQDSYWEKDQLTKYLSFVESNIAQQKYFSFGPNYTKPTFSSVVSDIKKIVKKIIHYEKKAIPEPPEEEVIDILISSGNIINLNKWHEVNGFNEDFFIDDVDHEFCLKLNAKYPGCVIKYNGVLMNHSLGEPKKTFFPRWDFHNGVRLYYCVRNGCYMNDMYPEFSKKWLRMEGFKTTFWHNLRDMHFKNVWYMIRGYRDYKKGIKGKFKK